MTRFLVVAWALASALTAINGQTGRISSNSELLNFMNSDLDYLRNQREKYSRIEGSAYLDESFVNGTISVGGKRYGDLQLRLNPYEGAVEFRKDDQVMYFMPESARSDTVWIGDKVYVNVVRQDGKSLKSAFMQLVSQGKTRVLVYHEVQVTEPKAAQGYDEAKPAAFIHKPDAVYVQIAGKPAVEMKGRKSLGDVFGDDADRVDAYSREHKLKLRSVEEVVALCEWYDSNGYLL